MYFRDMTFCPKEIHTQCADAPNCHRPLTDEVLEAANRWWGESDEGPPIAVFASRPECFVIFRKEDPHE